MPDDLPRLYWDANVFLSYINGIPTRLPDLDALLERSGTDSQIITSVISIVEVAFGKAEQDGGALDPDVERKIDALWTADSPIRLVEFYPHIAHGAKALMREALARGWKLKPLDAIHLATAQQERATAFHTYDTELEKYTPLIGCPVSQPVAKAPKLL